MFRTITQESNTLTVNYDATGSSLRVDKQEIGGQAVWSLSSAKPGFGVEQLRDDNIDTYWQYAFYSFFLIPSFFLFFFFLFFLC
jgi:hypothetical protein